MMLENEINLETEKCSVKSVKKRRKTRGQKRKERLQSQPQRERYDRKTLIRDNADLVKYYQKQPIFADGKDFNEFLDGLRATLPATFRINTFDIDQAKFLRALVQGPEFTEYLNEPASKVESNDEATVPPKDSTPDNNDAPNTEEITKLPALQPLVWYPHNFGWQMNLTRMDLRKIPILQQLHIFLQAETDNGFISRQEAVSMIPPLMLDVHRGQNILDMCAAPGSKTAQLVEYLKYDLYGTGQNSDNKSGDIFDDGMVVANDIDNKRCYMLVHQSSRLNSPNCTIINQDASRMPDIRIFDKEVGDAYNLKFDRVLCDVPCSGDGTARKNPDVWLKWNVGNANNFHGMQSKILKRGIEMLSKDGLLVYSTCSMNPVEDEAVIASVLRSSKGLVTLEDMSAKLHGLKYRKGMSDWIVMNREMEVLDKQESISTENVGHIYPSLFPPSKEEAEKFELDRCIRILPHLQDTGGFFVAVLKKNAHTMPWEEQEAGTREPIKRLPQWNQKKRRFTGFKEDPFYFMEAQDPDWLSLKNLFGLSENFPYNQLVHRSSSGKKRSIYLVSKNIRRFIIANREETGRDDFVKIINSGMRLFSRAQSEGGFRICQDGVQEILPYVKIDIKVPINKDDLLALIQKRCVKMDTLSSKEQLMTKLKPGSFIFIYKHQGQNEGDSFEMPLVGWKGETTVALYVSNKFRVHLCALVQRKIGDTGLLVLSDSNKTQDDSEIVPDQ